MIYGQVASWMNAECECAPGKARIVYRGDIYNMALGCVEVKHHNGHKSCHTSHRESGAMPLLAFNKSQYFQAA